MSFSFLQPPQIYLPFPEPEKLYRSKEWHKNKQSDRGELWLSNKYNFLNEILKFVPRAEAYQYTSGSGTLINETKGEYKDLKRMLQTEDFAVFSRMLDPTATAINKIRAKEIMDILKNNDAVDKSKHEESGVYLIKKQDLGRSDLTSAAYGLTDELEINTVLAIWYYENPEFMDLEFAQNVAGDPVIDKEDGFSRRKSFGVLKEVSEKRFESMGMLRDSLDFSIYPMFNDYYTTNEERSKYNQRDMDAVNFLFSRDELQNTPQKFGNKDTYYTARGGYIDGLMSEEVFPVYSSPDGHNRLADDFWTGDYDPAKLENFYPTDYQNLLIGLNPSMKKNDGTAPNMASYSKSLFGDAKAFFNSNGNDNGFYAYSDYAWKPGETITGNTLKTLMPSFYEIAMDPTSPWNDADSDTYNPMNGTWWEGKDQGQVAFNLAILMTESKRRYLAAMTELFGPHRQFEGATWRNDMDLTDKDYNGNLDSAMITSLDKWLPQDDNSGDWRGEESGEFNKSWLSGVLLEQHRMTNWLDLFGSGNTSGFTSGSGSLEMTRITAFRTWMLAKIGQYKTAFMANITGDFAAQIAGFTGLSGSGSVNNVQPDASGRYTITVPGGKPVLSAVVNRLPEGVTYTRNDNIITFSGWPGGDATVDIGYTYLDKSNTEIQSNIDGFIAKKNTVADSLKIVSYSYLELFDKIGKTLSDVIAATTNTAKAEKFHELELLINELSLNNNGILKKIKDGASYDELKHELFYEDGGSAHYDLQPSAGESGDGNKMSWDRTLGNFLTNIGVKSDKGKYIYGFDGYNGKHLGPDEGDLGLIYKRDTAYYSSVSGQVMQKFVEGLGITGAVNAKANLNSNNETIIDFFSGNINAWQTITPFTEAWQTRAVLSVFNSYVDSMTETQMGIYILNGMNKSRYDREMKKYKKQKEEEENRKIYEARLGSKKKQPPPPPRPKPKLPPAQPKKQK